MQISGLYSRSRQLGKIRQLILLFLMQFGLPSAYAENRIAVVTHVDSPLPPLSQERVVSLFLGKYKSHHDIPVKPLDNQDSLLREQFYMAVANMSAMRVKAYWSRIVFSGQGRPPREIATSEAASILADDLQALTYLYEDKVTDDMKILFEIPYSVHENH